MLEMLFSAQVSKKRCKSKFAPLLQLQLPQRDSYNGNGYHNKLFGASQEKGRLVIQRCFGVEDVRLSQRI